MSLTKLSLGVNYDAIHKLFLPRENLVSDIPAGDGNIEKLFLRFSDSIGGDSAGINRGGIATVKGATETVARIGTG